VLAVPRPNVAVLATGNELVEPGEMPGPGQIRNSNGPLLAALVRQTGATPIDLGIARDDAADLRSKVSAGLAHDVLVLSGGVSAGVLDLVPQVLAELGVRQVFHKVNLKPGKPLWFGVHPRSAGVSTLVFGLPGNPVSTLVSFELFVRPAIGVLSGRGPIGLTKMRGRLSREHRQRGERPAYWPSASHIAATGCEVTPLAWKGSGDLRTLSEANALACFPAGDRVFAAGETIEILLLDDGLSAGPGSG
ncbi:MAG TPA: molybdopterin molybdotransferase MoeA, partial [Pirellulaceae bacterium]|nr:molybdopterin molybdotransferase MoeA [Pirellulaceae bacterium]